VDAVAEAFGDANVVAQEIDSGRAVAVRCSEETWRAGDGAPLVVLRMSPAARRARPAPVVLVHGLRGARVNWTTSRRSFQAFLVEAGFDVRCPELRGSGASRAAGSPPPRAAAELLDLDLLPLVYEAACGAGHRVVLIGHSLGGILSCLAAAARPDLVEAVVAIGSPLTVGAGQPLVRLGARAWVAFASSRPFRGVAESPAMGRALMASRRLMDRLSLPPRVRSAYPGSMEPEVQAEFEAANRLEPGFPALLRDLSRLALGLSFEGAPDLLGELARVQTPVLCVAGDRDELAPREATLALFEALGSPGKRWLEAGDDEGHLGHTDLILGRRAPALVWAPIAAWLDEAGL
jgi:pimeloyl-ACP methyl ester carboxylesterase